MDDSSEQLVITIGKREAQAQAHSEDTDGMSEDEARSEVLSIYNVLKDEIPEKDARACACAIWNDRHDDHAPLTDKQTEHWYKTDATSKTTKKT